MRQTVELLVFLSLCVLLVRTFSAEAYVVPTGSMAPTLLGWHRELVCPNCRFPIDLGIDDEGHAGQAVCPNCGQNDLNSAPAVDCAGDRVLVQKFLYEFRPPKRWEVAVFHFPGDPSQAYVKRVVGLPGESIRISRGDVFADGRIVRKSLTEQRAMRVLVHDSRFEPADAGRFPRWVFRSGWGYRSPASGWSRHGQEFVHTPSKGAEPVDDWIIYRHWEPGRRRYGPVRDFYAYNGGELPAENEVTDLGLEARLMPGDGVESLSLDLRSGSDRFVVRIPVSLPGEIELVRNGRRAVLTGCWNPFQTQRRPKSVTLEASVFDRRLLVAVDGRLLFDPFDYESPRWGLPAGETPLALGVHGGSMTVSELRIYRDIHYTGSLASTPRQGNGIRSAVQLGPDEFFMLGDNSPVSNDSRFWREGPVVSRSMLLGKPFLVHLPGEVVPLKVFGHSVCWVPDPRRIRYIR
jgi:signal peptidase I